MSRLEKSNMGLGGTKCWLEITRLPSNHHLIDSVTICENYKGSKLAQLCSADENKGGKEHYIPPLHSSRAAEKWTVWAVKMLWISKKGAT